MKKSGKGKKLNIKALAAWAKKILYMKQLQVFSEMEKREKLISDCFHNLGSLKC